MRRDKDHLLLKIRSYSTEDTNSNIISSQNSLPFRNSSSSSPSLPPSNCKRNPEMVHGRYLSTFKGWLSPSSRPSPPSPSPSTPTSNAPCPISPEFQEQPPKLDDSLSCMNELGASSAGLNHEPCNQLSTFRKEAVNSPCDKEGPDLTNQDNYVALGIEDADMYRMISRKLLGGSEGVPGRMHAAPGRRIHTGSQAGSREASLYGSIDSIIMHEKDGKKKKE